MLSACQRNWVGLLGLCIAFALSACTGNSGSKNTKVDFHFPYEIIESDQKYRLPGKLVEVSGISGYDSTHIACIQDEAGTIFLLNFISGEVDHSVDFGKDGDYEGIEYVDGSMFVLRSSGKLYEVLYFATDSQETVLHKMPIKKENNPEGLAYDPIKKHLLISCKGYAGNIEESKDLNTVYSFDITTKELSTDPVYSFSVDQIFDFLGNSSLEKIQQKAAGFLLPGRIGPLAFHPSGMAVHPISGHIYFVTSKGNLMIILNSTGEIIHIEDLPKALFTQPEGITFFPNGDMLISNEGQEGIANIRRFNYIKQI